MSRAVRFILGLLIGVLFDLMPLAIEILFDAVGARGRWPWLGKTRGLSPTHQNIVKSPA